MYKRLFFLFLLHIFVFLQVKAQPHAMPDGVKISLLTYSPGQELYSLFGHSALRVYDPQHQSDMVYNYGTFDFSQPHFYFKFIKGNLEYSLSVVPFSYVKESAILENRALIESPLILTPGEKERITGFLQFNARPENRNYLYDFQYNNCSNRILEVLSVQIMDSLVLSPEVLPESTFRKFLNPYLDHRPWVHTGVDLLLGSRADRLTRQTEAAFLPDYLHLFIKNYRVLRPHGKVKLAGTDKVLVRNYQLPEKPKITPGLIFWTLALLMGLSVVIDSYVRKFFLALGNLFLIIPGILSLILLFLWIFPEHPVFSNNLDVLWANPLLLIIFFTRKYRTRILLKILLLLSLFLVLMGILGTLLIEHNTMLTALATGVAIQHIALLRIRTMPGKEETI